MLKLPFFNRERYILIKAYTFDRRNYKDKTFAMTGSSLGVLKRCPKKMWEDPDGYDFTTCYGLTTSMNRSLTINSWCEVKVEGHNDIKLNPYTVPKSNEVFDVISVSDSAYTMPEDSQMTKIICPWMMTCNKDTNFVMGKHIMNKLPMHIPTGILHFEATHATHIFNAVYKNQKYKIPYAAPLAQLFPLSDLPIQLETYWDSNMYYGLNNYSRNITHFRGGAIKLIRNGKK